MYSEENKQPTFYQIDAWHQYMHPYYWDKNILLEAELYSNKIFTQANKNDDYTQYSSYAAITSSIEIPFTIQGKTKSVKHIALWIKNVANSNTLTIQLNRNSIAKLNIAKQHKAVRYVIPIQSKHKCLINGKYVLTLTALNSGLMIDKVEIENE